nr:MAG TPA: hypothetical protein [Caudoviricetes sp.]
MDASIFFYNCTYSHFIPVLLLFNIFYKKIKKKSNFLFNPLDNCCLIC